MTRVAISLSQTLTSLPFVSPRSNHSTVTDLVSGLMPDTTAEWIRPEGERGENRKKLNYRKHRFVTHAADGGRRAGGTGREKSSP